MRNEDCVSEKQQAYAKCSEPQREKYWNELSIEDKIERMRNIVKDVARQCSHCSEKLSKLSRSFDGHIHAEGKIMVPVHDSYINGLDRDNEPFGHIVKGSGEYF